MMKISKGHFFRIFGTMRLQNSHFVFFIENFLKTRFYFLFFFQKFLMSAKGPPFSLDDILQQNEC